MAASSYELNHLSELATAWLRAALDEHKVDLAAGSRFTGRRNGRLDEGELEVEDEILGHLYFDAREDLATLNYARVTETARELLPGIEESEPAFQVLCRELLERHATYLEVARARLWGDLDKEREVLSRWPAAPSAPTIEPSSEPPSRAFSELLAAFINDRLRAQRFTPRSAKEYEHAGRMFIEICGDLTMGMLDSREVFYDLRDALTRLPSNASKRQAYRDKSTADLLQMDVPEADRPSSRTVEKNMTRVSSALKWGVREGWLPRNRAEGVMPADSDSDVRAYAKDELLALFDPQHYLRNRKPYQFWLPLLGVYTGCRISELVQLTADDIVEEEGVTVIRMVDDEAAGKRLKGKKGKRKASRRVVPVHGALIRLGFMAFVSDRNREAPTAQLFPEIAGANRDARGSTATKWFKRYRESCGVSGNEVDFHSFRRTALTTLNGSGQPSLFIKELVGHERGNVTQDTYHYGSPRKALKEVIDHLEYPLRLEELRKLAPSS